eukprot:2125117-Rhodomonas_salina.1
METGTERERRSHTASETKKGADRDRDGQTGTANETETETDRHRDRHHQTPSDTVTQTDRHRDNNRERERPATWRCACCLIAPYAISVPYIA